MEVLSDETSGRGGQGGTLAWNAPERLSNCSSPTKKSDVWSWAIVVAEMLSRVHPVDLMKNKPPRFAGDVQSHDDPMQQRRAFINWICSGKSCALPDFVPKLLHDLLKRCWVSKPSDRPSFKKILLCLRHMQIKLRDGDKIWVDAERAFRKFQCHYGNEEEEEEKIKDHKEIRKEKEMESGNSLSMSPLSTSLLTPVTFDAPEEKLRERLLSKLV